MTAQQRQTIKQKIVDDLAALHTEIDALEEKTQPIAPDCSLGRLTRLEAMGEKQVNEHSLEQARIRLNKLEYALRKVDSEDYGLCSECEEEIAFERLMLLPESTRCVPCINNG